jgi:hypothetical protein
MFFQKGGGTLELLVGLNQSFFVRVFLFKQSINSSTKVSLNHNYNEVSSDVFFLVSGNLGVGTTTMNAHESNIFLFVHIFGIT